MKSELGRERERGRESERERERERGMRVDVSSTDSAVRTLSLLGAHDSRNITGVLFPLFWTEKDIAEWEKQWE
jgi:hypothetical protein